MLTADHVDGRRSGGELVLRRLDARALAEARELAESYLEITKAHVGRRREELAEAWSEIDAQTKKRRLARGLAKLVDDACVFDAEDELDAVAVRRAVFLRGAEARRERGDARPFDRNTVLAEVAASFGKTAPEIETALFSDLRGQHVLRAAPPLNAASLVAAYELGQAQAVLLRAVRVVCDVSAASPLAMRAFFAKLKFHGLLFAVVRKSEASFTITIDGPFSMFESVTKYGLRLALILPALRTLDTWSLVADVRWGKDRQPLAFRLSSKDRREQAPAEDSPRVSDEVKALLDGTLALGEAGGPWQAEVATTFLEHPGVGLCVPDLVFRHRDGGEPVYVEMLGFWSRDAVWARVELAQRGLGGQVVFCASSRLRVSDEVLGDDAPAALYVFKGKPSARALIERVERVASLTSGAGRSRAPSR